MSKVDLISMCRRGVVASLLAIMVAGTTALAGTPKGGVMVFRHDTTPEYKIQYRIPAIAYVPKGPSAGTIVAVNDYRPCHGDIGAGLIDLHMATSTDGGKTWTPPYNPIDAEGRTVAKGTGAPGDTITNLDCGYGDAAIVADRETGRLLMLSCCGRMNLVKSRRANPQPSCRWWSDDGGKTWTRPDYTLWEQIYGLYDKMNGGDGQFIASGRIMQSRKIKVGDYYRIYAASMVQYDGFAKTQNYVFYSDDFGKTWNVLGGLNSPAPIPLHGDEAKVEELPDGSVVISGRDYFADRNINIFHYTDEAKGEGSWGEMAKSQLGLPDHITACNGELMIIPVIERATGKHTWLALHSIPFGPKRTNVGICWKPLDTPADYETPAAFAQGWKGRHQVTDLGSGYSTMTQLGDGRIGFFYEEATLGPDYCAIFVPLSIHKITGGAYVSADRPRKGKKGRK